MTTIADELAVGGVRLSLEDALFASQLAGVLVACDGSEQAWEWVVQSVLGDDQ